MQGSFHSHSHPVLHITEKESVCIACDDKVAIGATCSVMRADEKIGECANQERGLCFECVETMYSVLDACASCDRALRCVNNASHLLCGDGALPNAGHCTPSKQQDALLVTNNHVAKCSEAHFADGEACGGCPEFCVSCTDTTSCSVCAGGTSLGKDGKCAAIENAAVQVHSGAVACDDAFIPDKDGQCVSCSGLFGAGCEACSARECLSCNTDFVLDGGICRKGDKCAESDGTACTSCASGSVLYNATDCVPAGDCAVYEDERCVQCVEPNAPLADGTCGESEDCMVVGQGVCLRCADPMFADENGVCRGLFHKKTYQQRATRRVRHVRSMRRSAFPATRRKGRS